MRPLAFLLVLAGLASARQEDKIYSNSYKWKAPPELEVAADSWFNTGEKAVSLAELKGRVVYIEFGYLN